MRIAIVGGGAAGVCASLELAARGFAVDLYDENHIPVSRASHNNEGKIHLGYVYANDPMVRTARRLARGAVLFDRCLGRWIDLRPQPLAVSEAGRPTERAEVRLLALSIFSRATVQL